MNIQQRIENINWDDSSQEISGRGYAQISSLLTPDKCDEIIAQYDNDARYRKTINMERYRFGMGEYKYYQYPLPSTVQDLRTHIYRKLSPIANNWMRVLNIDKHYPAELDELLALCHAKGQQRPTPLILKYEKGGYNTLHQDLYGEVYFPLQMVLFLNEPGIEYGGGEFVLIEQRPRAQSKAIVLQPAKGDMLIFTTNFRPVKGSKGYYRVNMKHGVSEVTWGNRHTLGIIFHDAA